MWNLQNGRDWWTGPYIDTQNIAENVFTFEGEGERASDILSKFRLSLHEDLSVSWAESHAGTHF